MVLSRMFKLSEICLKENVFLRKSLFGSRSTRNFRRGRVSNEEPKINPESLATPFTNASVHSNNLQVGNLVKPFLFTVAFSGSCFVGAAIWEYENMRSHAVNMLKKPMKFFKKQADYGFQSTVFGENAV